MNIKKLFLAVLLVPVFAFSEDAEKRMSIQISPMSYVFTTWFLLSFLESSVHDNENSFYFFSPDLELQYAINNRFAFSITATLDFKRDISSYSASSKSLINCNFDGCDGDYDMDYEDSFMYIIKPAIMYHPFGAWLEGMYMSIYPLIGRHYVSSIYYDNVYTHVGYGVLCGYQVINDNSLIVQFGTGISKSKIISHDGNKGKFNGKKNDFWFKSNDFRFAFKVGYSF